MCGRDAARRGAGESGFTLLEAVVALTIVSVTGIAALTALGAELRTAQQARQAMEASALAADRAARITLLSRQELALLPDSLRRGVFEPPFHDYRWAAEAREGDEPETFEVLVRVEWDGGSYAYETLLYRSSDPPRGAGGLRGGR